MDRPTDVLSFPLVEYEIPGEFDFLEEMDECFNPETGELMLGDIIICETVAKAHAEEYGHSFEREVCYLIVHGFLHLLGYDHMEEDEKKEMRQAEEMILESIGITR